MKIVLKAKIPKNKYNRCIHCGETRQKVRHVAPYVTACYKCTPPSFEKRTAWKSKVFEKFI
ncbi:MAG TPA: hypothetical protein HA224_04220 [Nanoarchaeota archaeon]|nr:hypothetical protein [Nanoarchaeota archaeon]